MLGVPQLHPERTQRVPQHHLGHKHRGRGCCAISERARRSVFVSSSPVRMLSPTIPVHPRNAPVSPIIPVHTQKQRGGALLLNFQLLTLNRLSLSSPISCSPLATRHSPLSPINPAPLATPALRVVPAAIFTTTSSIHVGAPTILFRERTTASQQFQDRHALLSSNCALLTAYCELLFSPKSNYSRTYEPGARKSNHSRTYAKQGGGGRYLSGNVPKICRRADIFGVRRLAAAFTGDTVPPVELIGRNGWHRKSGSKLPHSKADPGQGARWPRRAGSTKEGGTQEPT